MRIILILLLLISCSGKKHGGVLTMGMIKGISSLDPAKAFDGKSLKLIAQSYEPLYQYHYQIRPFKIIPLLAEGMPKWSLNGTELTIKIKKGLKYHDHPSFKGKDRFVKAKDFINQLKRVAFKPLGSPGFGNFDVIEGFEEFSSRVGNNLELFKKNSIKGAKALDDHTLKFKLKRKFPDFLYYLTMHFLVPIPEEIMALDFEKYVVGTGPFYFSEIKRGEKFVLNKFGGFRKELYPERGDRFANVNKLLGPANKTLPFLDKLVFLAQENQDQIWKKFMDGEIDVLEDIPFDRLDSILDKDGSLIDSLENKGFEIKRFSVLINRWLGMNMRDSILGNNKNLRMAIAHAIDINAYNHLVRRNSSLQANSILTPGIAGYTPGHQLPYEYDLKMAKSYLAKAGYPEGKGLPALTYYTRNKIKTGLMEGKFFRDPLAKIGIRVEIYPLDFSEFLRKGRAGELQLWTDNWIYDFPDASNILQLLTSENFPGINKSGMSNVIFDEKFSELEGIKNGPAKNLKIRELEKIFDNVVPWVMLSYERSLVLLTKDIKNYRKSGVIRNYFKYISKD
jgi:ABC-type transport system substrate-binding protein